MFISITEQFHGSKESLEWFCEYVRIFSKEKKVNFFVENLSVADGLIINSWLNNKIKIDLKFLLKNLWNGRGLMLRTKEIVNLLLYAKKTGRIGIIGFELDKKQTGIYEIEDYKLNISNLYQHNKITNRYKFWSNQLEQHINKTVILYGFHMSSDITKASISSNIFKPIILKYGKQYVHTIATVAHNWNALLIKVNSERPKSAIKQFELESKKFKSEKDNITSINSYIPPTFLESDFPYAEEIEIPSNKINNMKFRQSGIWIAFYTKSVDSSIKSVIRGNTKNYDSIVYFKNATYYL